MEQKETPSAPCISYHAQYGTHRRCAKLLRVSQGWEGDGGIVEPGGVVSCARTSGLGMFGHGEFLLEGQAEEEFAVRLLAELAQRAMAGERFGNGRHVQTGVGKVYQKEDADGNICIWLRDPDAKAKGLFWRIGRRMAERKHGVKS